jgi:NAD(P)-dependent dehydrogenase (short-subunit alcohol dehydrogenase family)
MKVAELFKVDGLGVIVTGGASGIGLAFVEALAENGARVTILDIDRAGIDRECSRMRGLGWDVRGDVVDVTDRPAVRSVFDSTAALYGRIDVVFANAGVDPGVGVLEPDGRRSVEGAIENYEDERWDRNIDINLNAVFNTMKAAARHMKPRRSGRIIVTTSVASVRNSALAAAYPAAKAGVAALMRNVALELACYNINVNAIAPGPFATNIGGGHVKDPRWQERAAGVIPLHRVGQTEEMKGLALLLASPASSFMTGAEIFNDGGLSIGPPID